MKLSTKTSTGQFLLRVIRELGLISFATGYQASILLTVRGFKGVTRENNFW